MIRPGSHVLLLADARSVDARSEAALRALSAHHDVIALLVCDALERHPPPAGNYLAVGSEGAVTLSLDTRSATTLVPSISTPYRNRRHSVTLPRRVSRAHQSHDG